MTIDPRSHTPVYVQLADLIREQIESGALPPGASVGSESRLSQEHQIGRDAVRMAISLLRSEGLVTTSRPLGTRVRETPQRRQVELAAGARVVARMPTGAERRNMLLDEGVPVLEIHGPEGDVELLPGDEVELTRPAHD
ncbi:MULTISPECIES: GntR family transcriptional regulator [Micromonospora]|uniref:GntR family transcriptional regulator n=1 Tax=Micromonospora chalcea TaxID=1874 RepID=A0ABX9Y0Q7_MICCH|nr:MULTISPECIES: winged helix-turn-helix domain-containing protein [Micromonospora]EWM67877.1 GntR family transcriptional regulator [Micromonospora sp. M42]MBC8994031.1 winged helix-turn-helix transcriptional regulator [Micromonospora chalcea]MBF5030633.1 winged helix-turn-helix transcriptional regulator [Micromonospora sp. ANENR4]MBP1785297.1 DNA-binding transcriptional regulator YhcF (GntR family) [Micromonospora sp. HB375]MBQ1061696.1 winged helix-turn-helix transcriptional regulator [Micro